MRNVAMFAIGAAAVQVFMLLFVYDTPLRLLE